MSTEHSLPKRLVAEGLVITLSILAAFIIDAWWGVRQDDERLQESIATLESGFEEHISLIDEQLTARSLDDRLLNRFVNMDREDVVSVHPDSAFLLMQAIYRTGVVDPGVSFLVATIERSNLEALREPALERALAAWMAEALRLEQRELQLMAASRDGVRAVNRYPEVQLVLARPLEVADAAPGTLTAETLWRLREDNEVMAAAASKGFESRIHLRILLQVRARADSVHSLLKQSRLN